MSRTGAKKTRGEDLVPGAATHRNPPGAENDGQGDLNKTIRRKLMALAEPQYQTFSASLLPGTEGILGVRLPALRAMAKEIAKDETFREYLAPTRDECFEETMLKGMVIGCADIKPEERLALIADFIPRINNWSVCDSFCAGITFTKDCRARIWEFLAPYIASGKEFEARFAAVMLLNYFVTEEYLGRVLAALGQIRQEGYYAKVAVAWAISVCFVKFPEQTLAYLKENHLDDFTYQKALQKIIESKRIDPATRARLRTLKRAHKTVDEN